MIKNGHIFDKRMVRRSNLQAVSVARLPAIVMNSGVENRNIFSTRGGWLYLLQGYPMPASSSTVVRADENPFFSWTCGWCDIAEWDRIAATDPIPGGRPDAGGKRSPPGVWGERQIRCLVEIPAIKIEDFLPSVDRCMHAVGISINREKRMPGIVVRVKFVGFTVLLERLLGDRDILR